MKVEDIKVSDQVFIHSMNEGNEDFVVIGDTTTNIGFECFQIFTRKDHINYYFSLTTESVEGNPDIEPELMNKINLVIDSNGGRKAIIEAIQEKYNEKIFNTRVPEPEYRDELGKGNIIEYCIY